MIIIVVVIGFGVMGLLMVSCFVECFMVCGFDIVVECVVFVVEVGVVFVVFVVEVVIEVEVVLVVVWIGVQLDDLLFGGNGFVLYFVDGVVVIFISMVGMEGIDVIVIQFVVYGVQFVDVLLLGGLVCVGEGDFFIVVGVIFVVLEIVCFVLEQFVFMLFIVGDKFGDGQVLKIVNQLLCGVYIVVVVEVFVFVDVLGFDCVCMFDVFMVGVVNLFMFGNCGLCVLQVYDFEGVEVFSCFDIFVKDFGIVGDVVCCVYLFMLVVVVVEQLFFFGEVQGFGVFDDFVVICVVVFE